MRNALNREEKVAEVKARIKEGVQEENLALINKALEMALELGCQEDSQVVAAQAVQRRLTAAEEARSKTKSTKRALTLKMQSKSGVTRWVWRRFLWRGTVLVFVLCYNCCLGYNV